MAFGSQMLRGDCLASVCISCEMGKTVTQKHEICQLPRSVLGGGTVIGGVPQLRGSLCYFPGCSSVRGMTNGEPSWGRGNGGGGHGACGFRSHFCCLILRNEWLSWLPASLSRPCQMSSLEPRAWSRIQCFSPVEIVLGSKRLEFQTCLLWHTGLMFMCACVSQEPLVLLSSY